MKWVVSVCLGVILFLGYEVFSFKQKYKSVKKEYKKEKMELVSCKNSLAVKEFERFWSDEFSNSLKDENESVEDSDDFVVFDSF